MMKIVSPAKLAMTILYGMCFFACLLGMAPYMIANFIKVAGCVGPFVALVWLAKVIKNRSTKL